jgi:phosphodiesterase/alkaline phosphatase D-like protein
MSMLHARRAAAECRVLGIDPVGELRYAAAVTPSRRELLQLLGASSALLAVGCGDGVDGGGPVLAAAAVLDPDEDSFVVAIWSRLAGGDAIVRVRTAGELVVEQPLTLVGEIGRVEVSGLEAGQRYDVAIEVGGVTLSHRVRMAPAADDARPVRIAVSADCDPNPIFASGMLDAVVAAEPELMISLGDFPYTDNGPPAQTVAEYRTRHVELRSHPPVRALLEACGLCAIYDDHEFRNDWDARFVAAEPARYAAAMQVWDEFFPQRAPVDDIRYRSWRWGAHLECFLLDCRRFRSANSELDNEGKTMLGAAQRAWLIDGVTRSSATFKLVLTSVALDFGAGSDHWVGFKTERDGILAALVGVPGVLFVSADQHWFAAHRHAFHIRELQVGPLARGLGTPVGSPSSVLFRAVRYNAGIIDVDGDRLEFSAIGDDGEVFYREVLSVSDLTPRV